MNEYFCSHERKILRNSYVKSKEIFTYKNKNFTFRIPEYADEHHRFRDKLLKIKHYLEINTNSRSSRPISFETAFQAFLSMSFLWKTLVIQHSILVDNRGQLFVVARHFYFCYLTIKKKIMLFECDCAIFSFFFPSFGLRTFPYVQKVLHVRKST